MPIHTFIAKSSAKILKTTTKTPAAAWRVKEARFWWSGRGDRLGTGARNHFEARGGPLYPHSSLTYTALLTNDEAPDTLLEGHTG